MAVAVPGETMAFTLNPNSATQLSAARANPNYRQYVRIDNTDKVNFVAFAHNTNNQANAGHHVIPPGSYYEFVFKLPAGLPMRELDWGMGGDISAIAISGNPVIAYLEL